MKKPVRLLLLAAVALVVLLAVALGLALHSGVQTWAARRALASQASLKARLGLLNAGFQSVDLQDLQIERDGAVLTLPVFHAELSVVDAGLSQKVNIRRLAAKGWTLDLTKYRFPIAGKKSAAGLPRREFSFLPSAYAADSAAAAATVAPVFEGVFAQTALPFDLTLDGVELEGDVLLPPAPGMDTGRAHLVMMGGGFAAGREGALTFNLAIVLTGRDVPVNTLTVAGRLAATMDTPRTFSRLGTKADAAANGPQFPRGVRLAAEASATRDAGGETYSLTLAGEDRQLVGVQAELPRTTRKLGGTWKVDARDTDLAPFTLGRPLPAFTAVGAGRFDTEPASAETRATGKFDVSVDRLAVLRPQLGVVGPLRLAAEFDVGHRGDAIRVERLTASLANAQPVARVQALQTFEFNFKTRELKVADPARELLGIVIEGLPLAWAQPYLGDVAVTGGDLRGELVASARNDGVVVRAKAPLAATGISVQRAGRTLVAGVDILITASADYSPLGWQAELAPCAVRSAKGPLLLLEGRAGQLAGKAQPIKATGKLSAHLPAILAQPAARGLAGLTAGEATGTFSAASLAGRHEVEASLALTGLVADPKLTAETLPALSADVRADIAPSGAITFKLPLVLERADRKSDVTVAGTFTPAKDGIAVNAQVTSNQLIVDDAKILAAPFAIEEETAKPPVAGTAPPAPRHAPPWAGVNGQLTLVLKKVIYSADVQATDVAGTVRLEAGAVKLDNVRAGLGTGSDARLSGSLNFDVESAEPYTLAADLGVTEFDPAPIFRALNPDQPATVEGKFTVASKLSGQAASLADLAANTRGDFQLTSKGGVFRGLPVNVSAKVENTGKLAAGVALLGSAIGAVTGKKEYTEVASKAQAVAEVSKMLAAIQYDQLNVALTRDASFTTVLKDFTLIAPEMRLTGGGQATHQRGAGLLEEALEMEFKLRARGHTADLLKYLGRLEAQADELGYAACTLPLKIGGTIGKPDTSELNRSLASLAVEKSGATDLLNKLLGGK